MDKAAETKKSSTVASSETQEMVEIANKLTNQSNQ